MAKKDGRTNARQTVGTNENGAKTKKSRETENNNITIYFQQPNRK